MLSMFTSPVKEEDIRVVLFIKARVNISTWGHVEVDDMVYGVGLLLFRATSNGSI